MRAPRVILAFIAAVIVATVLSSIAQTQFNLAALQAMGVPMPFDVRFETTLKDLVSFTPAYGAVTGFGLIIAFLITAAILKKVPHLHMLGYTLAGGVMVLAALLIMDIGFGFTPVAAARSVAGFCSMVLCGTLGGLTFAWISRR